MSRIFTFVLLSVVLAQPRTCYRPKDSSQKTLKRFLTDAARLLILVVDRVPELEHSKKHQKLYETILATAKKATVTEKNFEEILRSTWDFCRGMKRTYTNVYTLTTLRALRYAVESVLYAQEALVPERMERHQKEWDQRLTSIDDYFRNDSTPDYRTKYENSWKALIYIVKTAAHG